nr:MAG TPA: hypothetical protein [Caudoviricetes sp.]
MPAGIFLRGLWQEDQEKLMQRRGQKELYRSADRTALSLL